HEATRLALRAHMAEEDRPRFADLSGRAAACFEGDDAHLRIERVYHRLIASPVAGAEKLAALYGTWRDAGRPEWLQSLGVALADLIALPAIEPAARARTILSLALIRRERVSLAKTEQSAREALQIFCELADAIGENEARDLLGDALDSGGRLADAL